MSRKQAEALQELGGAGAVQAGDVDQLIADGLGGGVLHPGWSAG
jgi:hypothetical protein